MDYQGRETPPYTYAGTEQRLQLGTAKQQLQHPVGGGKLGDQVDHSSTHLLSTQSSYGQDTFDKLVKLVKDGKWKGAKHLR